MPVKTEEIKEIKILPSGELILVLRSGGNPNYQHIYREAAEVYWDNNLSAFISPKPRKWSYLDWFNHIVKTTKNININLKLTESTAWVNITPKLKAQMVI